MVGPKFKIIPQSQCWEMPLSMEGFQGASILRKSRVLDTELRLLDGWLWAIVVNVVGFMFLAFTLESGVRNGVEAKAYRWPDSKANFT